MKNENERCSHIAFIHDKEPDMRKGLSTDCVHAGEDRIKPYDSITTPIIQSSTFIFKDSEDIRHYTEKKHFRYEYGRYGNPTQRAAEKKLRSEEHTSELQ